MDRLKLAEMIERRGTLTSTVNTVSALLLGAIADRGRETDERRLVLLGTSSCNSVVDSLQVAEDRD